MIKPDVIVCWPRNTDYPLWRQYIHDNRSRFNVVIVVFTETNQGVDYRQLVKQAMESDWILFVDSSRSLVSGEDWRNVAVNAALLHSYNAEWVWFTEQDFFPADGFWPMVESIENARAIGVLHGARLHPCSLLLRRDLLNELDKNFGIVPDKLDHFGLIQKQLEERKELVAIIDDKLWKHMNGLSHNMRLITEGGLPNHQVEEFNAYLKSCLKVSVKSSDLFTSVVHEYFNRMGIKEV